MKKLVKGICGFLTVTMMLSTLSAMALSPSELKTTEVSASEKVSSIIGGIDRSRLPVENKLLTVADLEEDFCSGCCVGNQNLALYRN